MIVERIGDATLMLGDCREILPALDGVRAIVSDPPYGIGYVLGGPGRNDKGRRHTGLAIVGDDAPFDPAHMLALGVPAVLFGADHYMSALPGGGMLHVWDKHCDRTGRDSFSDAELFWTSWTRKREVFRFMWKGIVQDGRSVTRDHPTQKPVPLMRFCIELLPRGEGAICDPYMGSGSTGVAAAQLGLPFIGCEIEPRYFDAARKRIEEAARQPRLFEAPPPVETQTDLLGGAP